MSSGRVRGIPLNLSGEYNVSITDLSFMAWVNPCSAYYLYFLLSESVDKIHNVAIQMKATER